MPVVGLVRTRREPVEELHHHEPVGAPGGVLPAGDRPAPVACVPVHEDDGFALHVQPVRALSPLPQGAEVGADLGARR